MREMKSEFHRAFLYTFLARMVSAVGGVLLVFVVGRFYGTNGVGIFAIAQSILVGAGIVAKFGMDGALTKYVGENHQGPAVSLYLKWALKRNFYFSLAASLVVLLISELASPYFEFAGMARVLTFVAIAVPFYSTGLILSGFQKGMRRPASASFLETGGMSLICAVFVAILNSLDTANIPKTIGLAILISSVSVCLSGVYQVREHIRHFLDKGCTDDHKRRSFYDSSWSFFLMSASGLVQHVLSILIIGIYLDNQDLGLYRTAERLALLISFVLMVINTVLPPRFSYLYGIGDIKSLNELARKGAAMGSILSLPLLFAFIFFPAYILSLFGDGFEMGSHALRIMAIAQAINVATGSVGYLLNMTKNEKTMSAISIICNCFGLTCFFIFTPMFGLLGAAAAMSIAVISQNLVALFYVWKRLGIWILPLPNVLSALKIRGGVAFE